MSQWEPTWLPGQLGSVQSWVTGPRGPGTHGAVLVPPLGYEYWTTFATLRDLAWKLADHGILALRFDYEGTGDSAGEPWDENLLEVWRADLRRAVDHVRQRGCSSVTLVGIRFGAMLALIEASIVGADAVVALAPVVSGKRYVRELSLLGNRVPDDDPRDGRAGSLVSGGLPFPDDTVAALKTLDLSALTTAPRHVLLLESPGAKGGLNEQLVDLGAVVDVVRDHGLAQILEVPTEKSKVPAPLVAQVADWVSRRGAVPRPELVGDVARTAREGPVSEIDWQGSTISEQVVLLASQLVAVRGDPGDGAPPTPDLAVVFLNTGAEHHVGPGRAWVEYARHLNARGWTTFRLDFTGWGESVFTRPTAGRPYAASAVADAQAAAGALRDQGFARVVLVGLCSSAWVGLRAALGPGVDAVYALNPQLYWRPGDPDDITVAEAAVWRARRTRVESVGHRYRVWPMLDRLGWRSRPGRWLDRLARRGRSIRLAFAEGDLGHDFLVTRLGRRLEAHSKRGLVSCAVIAQIDHQMHREWLREDVAHDLSDWLSTLFRPDARLNGGE
ncbi:MAG: hypothetical protein JWP14_188 [Frankiales bacterium]|jgi:hypothetical protein|nr:hypothetical protein [Frankiales bacterium]